MSAFLACHATEKGHDRALLLEKWTTAEALLSGSGLCRHEPCSDPEVSKDASGLTKPNCGSKAEREYMVSSPFASVRGIFWVQLPLEGASMRVLHSIRGEATPLNLAFRGFVWVIPARIESSNCRGIAQAVRPSICRESRLTRRFRANSLWFGESNLKTVESTLSQIRRRRARGTSGLWPSSP